MARTTATNYTGTSTGGYPLADAATDPFSKDDLQDLAKSVDEHDHTTGKGLAVGRLAANAVVTASITDLSVTAAKLAADAVETAKILDLNVTTGKIAANAITAAKVATADIPRLLFDNTFVPVTASNTFKKRTIITKDGATAGILDLTDAILLMNQGADVASGASIAVGDDGNVFVITGTTAITTITAKAAGTVIHLIFTGSGCQVNTGGNINTRGRFLSGTDGASTLSLVSDGSEWYEVGRRCPPIMARFYLAANQTITSGSTGEILGRSADGTTWTLDSSEYNNNVGITVTDADGTFTLPLGYWRCIARVEWVEDSSNSGRNLRMTKNGLAYRHLSSVRAPTDDVCVLVASEVVYSNGTDTFALRVSQESGSSLTIDGGNANDTAVFWEYLGA